MSEKTSQHAYIKHLVECNCILPQFRKMPIPPWHKFVVFSELEEETAEVKTSWVQCPNCDVVHRVYEIGLSEILKKDEMRSLPTREDIRMELPDKMCGLLDRHDCDLATWQEVQFIMRHKLWGRRVIIAKEHDGPRVIGKYVVILGPEVYKLENFERFDGFV